MGVATHEHEVFLSHSSRDAVLANTVSSFLEGNGTSVWIAPRDIHPGEDYATAIIRGIERARCLVLLLSKDANRSNAVRSEVERAFNKSKPIVPFRIEVLTLSRSLEFFLSASQWLDGSNDPESHFSSLLEAVTVARTAPPSIPPSAAASPAAKRVEFAQNRAVHEITLDDFSRREKPGVVQWIFSLFDDN